MNFLRPEARSFLTRWREVIGAAALALAGLWVFSFGGWFFRGVAVLIWLAAATGAVVALRRMRFPAGGGGVGLIEVDERQITYFAPRGGGSVSVDALVAVDVRTTDRGPFESDLFWIFTADDGATLVIPGDAENAAALFDALSALPGVDYTAATNAGTSTENASFVIWRRDSSASLPKE